VCRLAAGSSLCWCWVGVLAKPWRSELASGLQGQAQLFNLPPPKPPYCITVLTGSPDSGGCRWG